MTGVPPPPPPPPLIGGVGGFANPGGGFEGGVTPPPVPPSSGGVIKDACADLEGLGGETLLIVEKEILCSDPSFHVTV